jgi:hypothetical protein
VKGTRADRFKFSVVLTELPAASLAEIVSVLAPGASLEISSGALNCPVVRSNDTGKLGWPANTYFNSTMVELPEFTVPDSVASLNRSLPANGESIRRTGASVSSVNENGTEPLVFPAASLAMNVT